MLEVAAILPVKAYAPELHALRGHLAGGAVARVTLVDGAELAETADRYDLVYRMMGTAPRWQKFPLPEIHDYASLSTGRAARAKDLIKRLASRRPVLRSFLNEFVRDGMRFGDSVPWIMRDMGVPGEFLDGAHNAEDAEHDFVYVGSVTRSRGIDRLAAWAVSQGGSLLLVGDPDAEIIEEFKRAPGITFTGALERKEIPAVARSARFAVNYTPVRPPFDRQTSTKVLEYLALGMPVVTNDYAWIAQFEAESGAKMLRFNDLAQLRVADIESYEYNIPDMTAYRWDQIWGRSGIECKLEELAGARG